MRVAIVNDMALAREVLKKVVLSSPNHSVAWIAEDGEVAVRKALQDPPDLILMDLVMPVMDGVEATRRIMTRQPCPVLLVTSSVTGNFNLVYRAMGYGGLDAVNTPTLGPSGELRDAEAILARIEKIARTSVSLPRKLSVPSGSAVPIGAPSTRHAAVVAIGASTGGPSALVKILEKLPADFSACIVVVQHIAADFAPSLAKWLQDQCALPVSLAGVGEPMTTGKVLLAASNDHLVFQTDQRLGYRAEPIDCPYRPSVDVLFQSLAQNYPRAGAAVLLTGMGNDGAQGLLQLRHRGWHTIAQDQGSSIVYGMPKAAVDLDAASEILSIENIADAVARNLKR